MMFLSRCTKGISQENKKRKVEVCICYARRVTGTLPPPKRERDAKSFLLLPFLLGGRKTKVQGSKGVGGGGGMGMEVRSVFRGR